MQTRNAWQSLAVARRRQAQLTHPGEDTPLQRSNRRVCCVRDVTCNERAPFRPYRCMGCNCKCTARFLYLVTLTLDFWPGHSNSSEWRTKHVFRVNLAHIRSAVPSIHCRMWVDPKNQTRFNDFALTAHKWSPSHHRKPEVSEPKFTKFLYDVDRTSALLTRPSAFQSCHPLWNAIPKKEGVSPISADFAPKIVVLAKFKPTQPWKQ